MTRQILHIDLDAFFVSVERLRDPKLLGRPVVVGGKPGGRGVVASASYEARAFGIHSGMPLIQAQHLCPHAVFLPGRFAHYQKASADFMAILRQYTPEVEPAGIDEAYIELTGFEPIYGLARDTALKLKHHIKSELGLTASIGIATSKLVAKVASDLDKPDGLVEVPPGKEAAFLNPLPITHLPGVGLRTGQTLRSIGVTTIGQLAALPLPLLKILLGIVGETIHRWAHGLDNSPLTPPAPAKSISRSTTFPEDTLDRPFLRATLSYLSQRVGAELRRMNKRARTVTLVLRYADFETTSRSLTLKEPTNWDQTILSAGLQLMDKILSPPRHRVRLIGIGVSHFTGPEYQLPLFDPHPQKQAQLYRALDAIRQRYGFTAIQPGRSFLLNKTFPTENGDYLLTTPSLFR